jgi:hypothetical protein
MHADIAPLVPVYVYKGKYSYWYFTKGVPYEGTPYYEFRVNGGIMHEGDIGTIGTASLNKIHLSFKHTISLVATIR